MDVTRARLAALALAAVILAAAAVRLVGGGEERPVARPTVALDGAPAAAKPSKPGAPAARGPWVHVAGAVRRPGLYQVAPAARVAEALARAGGPTRRADLTAVNLAAPVEDGQQVVVVTKGGARASGPAGAAPGAGAGSTASSGQASAGEAGQPVSLSQATVEQLDALDGIGPTLAARILEHGKAHGGFRSVDQLQEVEGIGPKRFAALRGAVRP